MRTFIAIPVHAPPALIKFLSRLKELRGPLRTIPPEQLHLTVKFLGETDPKDIPVISREMTACFRQANLPALHLRGVGAFPRIERPSLIWAGLDESMELMRLAAGLEAACEAVGYSAEARPFHPHVTLARVKAKPPAKLNSILNEFALTDFGCVDMEKLSLYQSELSSSGPTYTVLSSACRF